MRKKHLLMAAILAVAVSMTGCSSLEHMVGQATNKSADRQVAYEDSYSNAPGMALGAAEVEEYDAAYEQIGEAVAPSGATTEKKVVWTGLLRIESAEYDKTVSEIRELISRSAAIVESSDEYDGSEYNAERKNRSTTWYLRVPSDHFNEFFDNTVSLTGQIRTKNISSADMTKQYNDAAVQIESLTIQQANLLEMMKSAKKIEDMLAIEDRLSDIRYQLQSLQNANSRIDYDVEYSSITVYLTETQVYESSDLSYVERLKQAGEQSLLDFIEAASDFLVNFLYALPYIIVLLIVYLILRVIWRHHRAKKRGELDDDDDDEEEEEEEEEKKPEKKEEPAKPSK